MLQSKPSEFTYAESGKPCSAQETLYHFFGLPIYVIAQPSGWYVREGRDFFNEPPKPEYYRPYTYPHPLQGGRESQSR